MNWEEALRLYIRAVYDEDHIVAGEAAEAIPEPYRDAVVEIWERLDKKRRREMDEAAVPD